MIYYFIFGCQRVIHLYIPYLRLKNITIGYSLPDAVISKVGLSKFRIYFAGDNLWTITNYKGLDPERAGDGLFVQYPQNKIISMGLNVEF